MTGDILSFHIFGQVIVVLNSIKVSKDLFDKRGDIYSDRPVIPILDMMKWGWLVPFARYGNFWRQGRRLLDRDLRPGAVTAYRLMQQMKARVLLTRLLASPDEWEAHIEQLQGELILAMTYGYEVQGHNDRKITVARQMATLSSTVTFPGCLLVNDLPFLRYIPEWLPWFSYKSLARLGHELGEEVLHKPMEFVKESMAKGTARPSLALKNLQETEKLSRTEREKAEEAVAGALASMYAAGTDTTVSAIMGFLVAILLHPDLQTTAQRELDAVTGRERLPTFEDRSKLPFVDAVCKEVLRWRPVGPLGLPHSTTEDDVYEGFFIPKATLTACRGILHNPEVYPEPDAFKPERFLEADGSLRDDPTLAATYGYGKRICPGRHLVDTTFFIFIASLLSVFNIERGKDDDVRHVEYSFTGAGISRPNPFRCSFIPRDQRAEELIIADTMAR
ncbi:cytochrome P450 [Multifurca ochricompacta]|uniref:Cytochrome P450 n=1 Tax=Multifurca ochricompacta TaxID=376703 RepID=A0AAD4QPF0_9AGAM|nr:cytochrome P450 [Multifurca ochricompacta]